MSWFPGAEISEDPTVASPNDGFLRTSPSPQPSHQRNRIEIESNANRNDFQEPPCPSWHMSMPQGLGLLTLPVTTDAGSDLAMTTGPFAFHHTTMSLAWPSEFVSSAPSSARTQTTRKDSWGDQSCDPLSTLLPGALWDHLRPTSSSVAGYDTSPGRSEYSRSTQPSAVSSPYANSDIYLHRVDSPQIKIEYPLQRTIPEINFVPEDIHQQHSRLLVNPDDLMAGEELSIEERLRTVLGSSSSSDNGDYKPDVLRPVRRRAHSIAEFDDLGFIHRRKRTHTKSEHAKIHCDECGKPFQRAYNLKSHISNVHNKHRAKQHACDRDGCNLRFVRNTDLRRHIESVCTCNILQKVTSNGL
jgi:hypothetical protein